MKLEDVKNKSYGNGRKSVFCKALLFICFFALFSLSLQAQDSDNYEFWFVAPDASNLHSDDPTFFMIIGDPGTEITISMPANTNWAHGTTTTIPATGFYKHNFSTQNVVNTVENAYTTSGTPTKKGILITSNAPISAYYQIDGSNQKDIFTLKGEKALGTEFYMPFQTAYKVNDNGGGWTDAFRQIQIVATESNTKVTITPTGDLAIGTNSSQYVSAGTSVEKTLQKGETLLWRGRNKDTFLTGSHITSDKPIAVTLFEDCLQNKVSGQTGGRDPIGDQLVPVNNLGQNYIVVKGYSYAVSGEGSAEDHAIIVAVEDNTDVWLRRLDSEGHEVEEKKTTTSLSKGQHISIPLGAGADSPEAYYITTNNPVYCMHQSAAGVEIGGALLPSLYSLSASSITFMQGNFNPENDGYINAMFLVFRETAQDGFTLDKESLDVNAKEIGFEDWMYAKVTLPNNTGNERVRTVANSKGTFALGYFTGRQAQTALYGYLSAFGTFSFPNTTTYNTCGENSYQFSAPYAKTYKWERENSDGTVETLLEGSTTDAATYLAEKSGKYILTLDQEQGTPIVATTHLILQNFNNELHAPSSTTRLLVNKSYKFSIKLNPENDPYHELAATYQWTFGDGAVIAEGSLATDPTVKASYSTAGDKKILLEIKYTITGCSKTFEIPVTVIDTPDAMYWKTNVDNRDWNDEGNWETKDADGNLISIEAVPSAKTKVYLPGDAAKYPSLKEGKKEDGYTDWTYYGQPEAGDIVFCYGSQLHYQHKLSYKRAFIQYNWGYYKDDNPIDGQPPHWADGKRLERDKWHILAAPLKSMASGDFSLAGRPFSWQRKFNVTTPVYGGVQEGGFTNAFPTNDVELETTNNAIAVKMAGYESSRVGYKDHKNLDGLHGVIEIPYFENRDIIPYYPAHSYDALSKRSYFYYFDTKTLKIINSPVGSKTRAGEAYRFVYETDQNELPANNTYIMPLNTEGLGSTEVMVGNPLLAPIDAKAFAIANTDAIVFDEGYKLLSNDDLTWQQHSFTENDPVIPAWKAFIVTLRPGTSTLSFPLESTTLRSAVASGDTRSAYSAGAVDDALTVQVLKGGTRSGDAARLQHNRHTGKTDIRKMILPEGHEAPEIFFISSDGKSSNLIQQYNRGEKEVAIGVKTTDVQTRLSLKFANVAAFSASTGASVILVDKHQNVRQDLTRNPVYSFKQQAAGLDNQYVDRQRFVLQLGGDAGQETEEDTVNGIDIVYRSGVLEITSDENIHTVSVYDLYGRLAFSSPSVNLTRYTHVLQLQGKMYLVRVKTVSGKEKVRKIMGN